MTKRQPTQWSSWKVSLPNGEVRHYLPAIAFSLAQLPKRCLVCFQTTSGSEPPVYFDAHINETPER